jgi:hypothetical protein
VTATRERVALVAAKDKVNAYDVMAFMGELGFSFRIDYGLKKHAVISLNIGLITYDHCARKREFSFLVQHLLDLIQQSPYPVFLDRGI